MRLSNSRAVSRIQRVLMTLVLRLVSKPEVLGDEFVCVGLLRRLLNLKNKTKVRQPLLF